MWDKYVGRGRVLCKPVLECARKGCYRPSLWLGKPYLRKHRKKGLLAQQLASVYIYTFYPDVLQELDLASKLSQLQTMVQNLKILWLSRFLKLWSSLEVGYFRSKKLFCACRDVRAHFPWLLL